MSNDAARRARRPAAAARRDLGRLLAVGLLAALLVSAARLGLAQGETATEAPPAPTPAAGSGSRPSVEVSADAAVDFPGDI